MDTKNVSTWSTMDSEESPKSKILFLSRVEFLKRGFAHTSVDDLSGELGISKKTFYKCFKGKEDLVAEIIRCVREEIKQKIETVISGDQRFIEKLHGVMTVLGVQISTVGKDFQQDLQKVFPQLWAEVEDFRRDTLNRNLTLLLEQGKREGAVRSDANIRLVLLAYTGAIDRIMRPDVLAYESFSMHEALRDIMAVFFHGILTDEASRELVQFQHTISSQSQ